MKNSDKTLLSAAPDIAAEWHPTKNIHYLLADAKPGSHKRVWWLGKCGHEWKAQIANRVQGKGCPYCNRKIVLQGENDLLTCFPSIASEWDKEKNSGIMPNEVFAHSGRKYWWLCPVCGHSWRQQVCNRTAGKGCPVCAKNGTSFPEQAIFYYISKVYPDAINRDKSIGMELDIFIPSINVAIEYDGTPYHSSSKSLSNDIKKDTLCKEKGITLYRFRDPSQPQTPHAIIINGQYLRDLQFGESILQLLQMLSIDTAVDLAKDYYQIIANARKYNRDHSIRVTHPELIDEWHPSKNLPLTPDYVTAGAGTKIWWKCQNGHEWSAYIYSRTGANQGCPICAKSKRGKAHRETTARKNNFAAKFPDLAKEWNADLNNGIHACDISSGCTDKFFWNCSVAGHPPYRASVHHRVDGTGCPLCGRIRTQKAAGRKVRNLDTGEVFNSLDEAGKAYGGHKGTIYNCASGKTKTAYGCHWAYLEKSTRIPRNTQKIKNIETGELFDSIQAAADKYQCDRSSISSALRGKTKSSQGYHWTFIDE